MCMWFGLNPAVNFCHFSTLLTSSFFAGATSTSPSSIYIFHKGLQFLDLLICLGGWAGRWCWVASSAGRSATFAYSRARACCACSRCGTGGLYIYVFHLSSISNVLSFFGRWLNMTEIL